MLNEKNDFALVPKPPSAVEKAAPGAKRVLASMVVDVLALSLVGDAEKQYQKGFAAYNGRPPDFAEAVNWYRKAAEQGHAAAQHNLALCYYNGQGVAQNYSEAFNRWRKAVPQGYAQTQFQLGGCYFFGQGVAQDYTEAVKWFRKAAEQGDAVAQYFLGGCYFEELGVSKSDIESYKWIKLAVEQGYKGAKEKLASLTSKMSPHELNESEQRYRQFKTNR